MQLSRLGTLYALLWFLTICLAIEESQVATTSSTDPVALWKDRANSVAKVVQEALQRHSKGKTVRLKHVDVDSLRIWHGQRLELELDVDSNSYKFFTESEPEWHSLTDTLPPSSVQAGAVVTRPDWELVERNWLAPITQGPLLPDFVLEGPLDLYLVQPTALQMFLPHSVEVGRISRVLLRDGACVTVRGARSVGLRRSVDLPSLSLGDFASIATADAQEHPAAGVLHLLSGLRSAAVQRWNVTHPDLSLAVVSLELEFSPHSGALMAAPTTGGLGLQRLKPRRLREGVVELLPRDGGLSEKESKALALAPGAPYAWPLRSMHPQHLQVYEQLLREVLGSQVFGSGGGSRGKQRGGQVSRGSGEHGNERDGSATGVRFQPDMQLRLRKTQAEATTLLQLRVEVERRKHGEGGSKKASDGGREGLEAEESARGEGLEQPPDALAVLVQPKSGPHEVWDAVVQVKQDPESGALQFVPVRVQQADATLQTVSFSPGAMGAFVGNMSALQLMELADLAEQHGEL